MRGPRPVCAQIPRRGTCGEGARCSIPVATSADIGYKARVSAEPEMAEAESGALPDGGGETKSASPAWHGWFAIQDIVPLVYLVIYRLMVWFAPDGPFKDGSAEQLNLSLLLLVTSCIACRGVRAIPHNVRAVLYRLMLGYIVVMNYLMLRDLLPLVSPHSLDDVLLNIDKAIFGVVPALWLERLNTRPIVEWFSFFYLSYFWMCALLLVVVFSFIRSDRAKTEFTLGSMLVLSVGQLCYSQVPGFGPIRHMVDEFAGPINGGRFWGYVWDTVQAGSAMKDIFPSIHTAMPTWVTFFCLREATLDDRWRWPSRMVAFFTANIVFSTVFLRWHYVIDVFAGLALAAAVIALTPRLVAREAAWRETRGLRGVWRL
jgi:membrane-associated phospholipid phosphatase